MNIVGKIPISELGYQFIPAEYLPTGKNEYYLRNKQNRSGINYRHLTDAEKEAFIKNLNTSDDWNNIYVSDEFNPDLVKNCKFFGLIRIGKLEPCFLSFHDVKLPVGLYNSTIISCDFGDNAVINNVNYLSHMIIGNEVMIVNVLEMATTNHAKFGNGVLKQGEKEDARVWIEVCNENGGRKIIPFNGMLPGDAYLWSKYRADEVLMEKFKEFTEKRYDNLRGYYGKIGDRTIIKNCGIIKDVWIGEHAYIKGANKLKNLTINSSVESKTQIGEGCELVNGIIGNGCRIFYGSKAVRFFMASNSQLKYGARLINSYLGNNATISCCEVLNSLIFPAHEQHHNNSFLCAALIMGQSNIAAGATIGSNHNSRAADGEIIAGRGFWPGLCVSLKHNSKFAGFTLIAKGDYPSELNIPIPFSLIINDESKDSLNIMPGYWFMYNMYALARNSKKLLDRDQRTEKTQELEYDYLAPDSINEIFDSLSLFKKFTGKSWAKKNNKKLKDDELILMGEKLLETKDPILNELEIVAEGFENSKRKVLLLKVPEAYQLFKELIRFYGTQLLMKYAIANKFSSFNQLMKTLPAKSKRDEWQNIGGQLMQQSTVESLIHQIHSGKIKSWDHVHNFYLKNGKSYTEQKLKHGFAALLEILGISVKDFNKKTFGELLKNAKETKEKLTRNIYESRKKDYTNPFRKMLYDTEQEMDQVIGSFKDNEFILEQNKENKLFQRNADAMIKNLKL